jgi:DNA-binding XRE family transcriptional regulator
MSEAGPSRLLCDQGEIVLTGRPGCPEIDSVAVMLPAMALSLRRARVNQGIVQSDAAARAGMSVSVLSRIELARRVPGLRVALVVCNVLGIRFSDVMRAAEDEAFPLGGIPWTDHPARLLKPITSSLVDGRGVVRH